MEQRGRAWWVVQVAAGNQLFHIVVENDEIATRITGLLREENGGRATFIPLNRLHPQDTTCVLPSVLHAMTCCQL
jgi:structural maintenance of chromosome 3 (chondroitin sulfate proteoglycan 6)